VEAVTGSGKTLAFLIPILEILRRKNGKGAVKIHEIQALILSPTRELAKQIGEALDPFLEAFQLKKFVSVGGSDPSQDVGRFKTDGGNIVIGTPGRIEDLCQKHPEVIAMKGLEVLVLDEADRLLDMGFEKSVNSIISKLPKQRRTGLFSATMTNAVNELIRAGLRNPVRVTVKVESKINQSEQKIPDSLKIYYHTTSYEDRLAFLIDYLSGHASKKAGKAIVYFGTCACVDYFAKACKELCRILKRKLNILALHGRMEHKRRENVYKEFSATDGAVLFCTDLAARGLDFPDIELVIQFDAPQDPASFVHRCGRTARVGRDGTALLLLDPKEEAFIDFLHGKMVPIEKLDFDGHSLTPPQILSALIKVNSEDRELYEKSLRAFVSYMRFYQEHHAKFIFSFKDLDIGGIAKSFGLLHVSFHLIDFY
jgi:ATP-dependent RNA helicase DDX55/SPB4